MSLGSSELTIDILIVINEKKDSKYIISAVIYEGGGELLSSCFMDKNISVI